MSQPDRETLDRSEPLPRVAGTAIDLFAGAGGVTSGFKEAGATVLAAVEIDHNAAATFRANHPEVRLLEEDIRAVEPERLRSDLGIAPGDLRVLSACAPCQGFSSLGTRRSNDPRNDLVLRVLDFVAVFKPHAVSFENVPRLVQDTRFAAFLTGLNELGYGARYDVVDAADFGVPQRRRRLVLVAVAGRTDDDVPRVRPGSSVRDDQRSRWNVRQAFADLDLIDSGDPLHASRSYPGDVLARIRAIPKNGGSRRDLPPGLRLRCHEHLGGNAASAYGRMKWNDVAPTLTTRCTSPSCGRFVHPEEDRAITPREAAALQSFPSGYEFKGGRMSIEAQIGNAVPVNLAAAIWQSCAARLE
jgi:DNA (cytosine-5)-methyltransferase 1